MIGAGARLVAAALGCAALAACSGNASDPGTGGGGQGGASTTSTGPFGGAGGGLAHALDLASASFQAGDQLPDDFTCAGANASPDLTWSAGPLGTKSFA